MKYFNFTGTIQHQIFEMLTENTGKHFLDSGGDDNRQWQKNRKKGIEAMKNEPEVVAELYKNEIEYVTVSTFHFLNDILDRDNISDQINEWILENGLHWVTNERVDDLQDMVLRAYNHSRIEHLSESHNTYNYENNLDHVLQFRTFTYDGEVYVLLQVHLGADVRGGYSKMRCFRLDGYITGNVDVYGSYETLEGEDIQISNMYDGFHLTDDNGNKLHELTSEKIDLERLYLNYQIMDDFLYLYEGR